MVAVAELSRELAARVDDPEPGSDASLMLDSTALSDGASPLNVLGGIPTVATDYSPIWDLNPGLS